MNCPLKDPFDRILNAKRCQTIFEFDQVKFSHLTLFSLNAVKDIGLDIIWRAILNKHLYKILSKCYRIFSNCCVIELYDDCVRLFILGNLGVYISWSDIFLPIYSIVQKKSVITILLIVWVLVSVNKRNFPRWWAIQYTSLILCSISF